MKYVVINNDQWNDNELNLILEDAIKTNRYKCCYVGVNPRAENTEFEYYLLMPDMCKFRMGEANHQNVIAVPAQYEHEFDDFIIALQSHNGASNILDNAVEYQGCDADEVYSYLSDLKASSELLLKNLDTIAKIELETVLTRKVLRMVIDGKF